MYTRITTPTGTTLTEDGFALTGASFEIMLAEQWDELLQASGPMRHAVERGRLIATPIDRDSMSAAELIRADKADAIAGRGGMRYGDVNGAAPSEGRGYAAHDED